MKNRILYILLIAGLIFSGCKNDEFDGLLNVDDPAEISIIFNGNPNVTAASIPITDLAKITVDFKGETVTSVDVTSSYRATSTATVNKEHSLGSLPVENNVLTFSKKVRELVAPGDVARTSGTPAIMLIFSINTASGKTLIRRFTVTPTAPVAFSSTAFKANPTTANNDSSFFIKFSMNNLEGFTSSTTTFMRQRRPSVPATAIGEPVTKTYDGIKKSITDSVAFTVPDEANIGLGDTIVVRTVVTSATGETFSITRNVRNVAVAYGTTRTVTLFHQANTGIDLPNAWSFTRNTQAVLNTTNNTAIDENLKSIKAIVSDDNVVGFMAGTGNATEFVKVTGTNTFAALSNFQAARNMFESADATKTSIVERVLVGERYIAKVAGASGSAQYVVIEILAIEQTATNNRDNFTFRYAAVR